MSLTIALMLLRVVQLEPQDSDIACIVDRVPESVRALILDEVGGDASGPARLAVADAARVCAERRVWTAVRSSRAEMLAVARLVGGETRHHLDQIGIPVALVDEWFDGQSRDVQTNFQMSDAAIADLFAHLVGHGVERSILVANLRPLGHYLGARMSAVRVGTGSGSTP